MARGTQRSTPSTDGTNVIKATGASKGKAQKMSDHARPRGVARPARMTDTRQGGSPKGYARGDMGNTDTAHPSQRGGANALGNTLANPNIRKGKQAGKGRSDRGLTKASKESTSRPGTSRSGSRSRRGVRNSDGTRQRRSPGR
ncbi:MAG TPA: hypothetical protein VD997_01515 [Phycisphaerales bacterium]|nr:hypothetical protein [Phycisphaerales bacterium]